MFGLGPWELLIILAIVLLIFGPKRLKTIGSDLGNAIKGFRSAVKEREQDDDPNLIDGDAAQPPKQEAHERSETRAEESAKR